VCREKTGNSDTNYKWTDFALHVDSILRHVTGNEVSKEVEREKDSKSLFAGK